MSQESQEQPLAEVELEDTLASVEAVEAGDVDAAPEDDDAAAEPAGAETAVDEPAVDEAPEEIDPIDEFKKELRRLPGDWYVIHSYAG